MQLLIILALLLYGGRGNAQQLLEEVKPVLQEIGGEEMAGALKSAEEISAVLSAVRSFAAESKPDAGAAAQPAAAPAATAAPVYAETEQEKKPTIAFPLAPINDIADREITYSLSKYIANKRSV